MKRTWILLLLISLAGGCSKKEPVVEKDVKTDSTTTSEETTGDAATDQASEKVTEGAAGTAVEVAAEVMTPAKELRDLMAKSASAEELMAFAKRNPASDEAFNALNGLARNRAISDQTKTELFGLIKEQFVVNEQVDDTRAMEASKMLLGLSGMENRKEVIGGMFQRFVENAKDLNPTVSQAITIVLQAGSEDTANQLRTKLIADFADDPLLVGIVGQMARGIPGPSVEKFLTDLSEKSTNEQVQGMALITLAKVLAAVPDAKSVLKNEQFAASLSEETRSYINDFEAADQAERITELLNRVSEDFADVDGGRGQTLGEIAAGELFVINHLSIGKEAPDIEGEDLDGETFRLSDYRGKVVMVDFWGEWCVHCRAMYPHERSLVKQLSDKPFAIIGINSDKDRETIQQIVADKNITWRSFWNGPEGSRGPISSEWRVSGWPTIYVLDENGVIRYKNVRGDDLDEAIVTLLSEMGHEVELGDHDEEQEVDSKKEDGEP